MNKIIRLFLVAFGKNVVILRVAWQRSSVVEQRNHNPLVGGPNPSAATKIWVGKSGPFFNRKQGCKMKSNQKNKMTVMAFLMAVKKFAISVADDFKDAQRNLEEVRERMNQRSK